MKRDRTAEDLVRGKVKALREKIGLEAKSGSPTTQLRTEMEGNCGACDSEDAGNAKN